MGKKKPHPLGNLAGPVNQMMQSVAVKQKLNGKGTLWIQLKTKCKIIEDLEFAKVPTLADLQRELEKLTAEKNERSHAAAKPYQDALNAIERVVDWHGKDTLALPLDSQFELRVFDDEN